VDQAEADQPGVDQVEVMVMVRAMVEVTAMAMVEVMAMAMVEVTAIDRLFPSGALACAPLFQGSMSQWRGARDFRRS
jgi:hypothetical protein